MTILVLNSGSSSIKFLLSTPSSARSCARGCRSVGLADAIFNYQPAGGEKSKQILPIADHTAGIKLVLDTITSPERGVIAPSTSWERSDTESSTGAKIQRSCCSMRNRSR